MTKDKDTGPTRHRSARTPVLFPVARRGRSFGASQADLHVFVLGERARILLERAMGIEPTSEAWEAKLNARERTNWRLFCVVQCSSNGFQLEQRSS